jgi:uncharacterized repeat protein (TIGR01451 family)
MKSRYLPLLVLVFFFCMPFRSIGQTFTSPSGNLSVTYYDTIYHDSVYCSTYRNIYHTFTKLSAVPYDTVYMIDTLYGIVLSYTINLVGTSPWTDTFSRGNGVGDYGLGGMPGMVMFPEIDHAYKFVSGTDTVWVPPMLDSFYVTNPCQFSTVSGQLFNDVNGNCTYDTGELLFNGVNPTNYQTFSPGYNSTSTWPSYTSSGYYFSVQQSWLASGSVFLDSTFSFIFPSTCFIGPYSYTTVPQTGFDIPLQCSSNLDVQCWMGSPGRARPARALFVQPYVSNLGCDAVSGVLTLVKDHRVTYNASLSAYPADVVMGDTLQWNYSALSSLSSGAYWNSFMASLHMTPDSSVTFGDTLCFHIFTGVPTGDINPANNDQWICIPVVTSYDPNIKEVAPAGDGPTGDIPSLTDELTYTIHFQNTGTAEAIDIHVTDTLDSHVDPTSLKVLGASHLMNPRWRAGNVVDFQFPNIWLADSFHNEPASHGYVRFKVKLNTHTPGTQIKNKGYIYFDTNPAVITNQTLNTLVHTAYVPNVAVAEVKVYPNPASDAITVENLQDGLLTIVNMNGAVVLQQTITGSKTEININRLPTGVYVLKTVNKTGTTTRKFVKE